MRKPIRLLAASWSALSRWALLSFVLCGCPEDDPLGQRAVSASPPQIARAEEALSVAGTGAPASRQPGTQSRSQLAAATATATAANSVVPIADNALRQA